MTSSPLVSAVIATYNRRQYVQQAIESVLNQTYPHFELIVIDDGSTDGTGSLIQEKYGERIHYIYQENSGRSEARNHGMDVSKGKYIAFLDSDDMWKPEKLAHQIAFMEQHPEYELTHTFVDDVRGDIGETDVAYTAWMTTLYRQAIKQGYTYLSMSRRCIMFWSTVIVRSMVAKSIGPLDASIDGYEDWDWYLHASLVTQIGTLEEPLTWYRIHSENTTTEQFHKAQVTLAQKHLAQIDRVPAEIRKKAKRNFYLQLATVAYQSENKQECAHWIHQVAQIDPLSLVSSANAMLVLTTFLPNNLVLGTRWFLRKYRVRG